MMAEKTMVGTETIRKQGNELILQDSDIIVSKTDTGGLITYGNALFVALSGYSEQELLGKPHNIIRHPDMPHGVFHMLWSCIKQKLEFNGFIKNLSKDGISYYWVFANVTPSFDRQGKLIGYFSVRRKAPKKAIDTINDIYAQMRTAEARATRGGGCETSIALLNQLLETRGQSYDEFVFSLYT